MSLPWLSFVAFTAAISLASAGADPGPAINTGQPAPEIPPARVFDLQDNALEADGANRTYRDERTLVVYLPQAAKSTGTALVVFPGGGYYGGLDMAHHVQANARYFVPRGIAIIGVRYRVAKFGSEVTEATVNNALADAQQAMRLVRSRASDWNLNPECIGVLGYSAGAHLALTLACHFDLGDAKSGDPILRQSCRPDFMAVLCPWPRKEHVSDFRFGPHVPPVFIASAIDDKIAPSEFAIGIAESLRKVSVPVELHLYPKGGHMAFHFDQATEASKWPERFLPWLSSLRLATSPAANPS